MEPQILAPGMQIKGPATTNGLALYSRAGRTPAKRSGLIKSIRMTNTIMTGSTRTFCSTSRSGDDFELYSPSGPRCPMYVMDRATGEVIWAENYAYQNTSDAIDMKTGRIRSKPEKAPSVKTVRDICPAPRVERIGSLRRSHPRQACFTSHTTIFATKRKVWRRTISRVLLM